MDENFNIMVPLKCHRYSLQRGPFCSLGGFETCSRYKDFTDDNFQTTSPGFHLSFTLSCLLDSTCRRRNWIQSSREWFAFWWCRPRAGLGVTSSNVGLDPWPALAGRPHGWWASGIFSNLCSTKLKGTDPMSCKYVDSVKYWWLMNLPKIGSGWGLKQVPWSTSFSPSACISFLGWNFAFPCSKTVSCSYSSLPLCWVY